MSLKHVNVVVIGSGAGGGVVAKELSEAGLDVVLLERGRWITPDQDRKDDLRNQRTTVLGTSYGPDETKEPRVFVIPGWPGADRLAGDGNYNNNAACVGGGTVSYGAMAWRFMAKDFRMKSIYGAPAGSTLDDWPISYADLEPFYEKAEWEIGVSGDIEPDPFKAPRRRPLPMPPLPGIAETPDARSRPPKRLGLASVPHPDAAEHGSLQRSRPGCMHCRWCCGFACAMRRQERHAKHRHPHRPRVTGNCELRTRCIVAEIVVDDRGARAGGGIFRRRRPSADTRPPISWSSPAAPSNPRASCSIPAARCFPTASATAIDWVGRNLQGHAYTGAFGLFEHDIYDDLGPGADIAIMRFQPRQSRASPAGCMLANEFMPPAVQVADMRPPGTPRWGKAHKDFMRDMVPAQHASHGPVAGNAGVRSPRAGRIPMVKDHWGIPWPGSPASIIRTTSSSGSIASDKAEQWLKEAGAIQTHAPPEGRSRGSAADSIRPAPAAWATTPRPPWWTSTASSTTSTTSSSPTPACT